MEISISKKQDAGMASIRSYFYDKNKTWYLGSEQNVWAPNGVKVAHFQEYKHKVYPISVIINMVENVAQINVNMGNGVQVLHAFNQQFVLHPSVLFGLLDEITKIMEVEREQIIKQQQQQQLARKK